MVCKPDCGPPNFWAEGTHDQYDWCGRYSYRAPFRLDRLRRHHLARSDGERARWVAPDHGANEPLDTPTPAAPVVERGPVPRNYLHRHALVVWRLLRAHRDRVRLRGRAPPLPPAGPLCGREHATVTGVARRRPGPL